MEILSCGEHSVPLQWSAASQQTIAMADSDYFTALKCIIGTLHFDQRRGTQPCHLSAAHGVLSPDRWMNNTLG